MFALLDCLFFEEIHIKQNKECKPHIKGKNEFLFAKALKFSEVQMGHLHPCPLPTTPLSHILHNEETRDNTFDYIFYSQLKKLLLKFSHCLI